jgi:hypothetical protein
MKRIGGTYDMFAEIVVKWTIALNAVEETKTEGPPFGSANWKVMTNLSHEQSKMTLKGGGL